MVVTDMNREKQTDYRSHTFPRKVEGPFMAVTILKKACQMGRLPILTEQIVEL